MPWGPRVADPSPIQAEGDKLFVYATYNDQSGGLVPFQPMYKDFSDAAEYNVNNVAQTSITVGTTIANVNSGVWGNNFPGMGANQAQSLGRVVTGTNTVNNGGVSLGTPPLFVGIYNPENFGTRPSTGDTIRLQRYGATPVAISTGGATVKVADYLRSDVNQPFAVTQPQVAAGGFSTGTQPSNGLAIFGRVLATGNQISSGANVTPATLTIPPSGFYSGSSTGAAKYQVVNGFIDR